MTWLDVITYDVKVFNYQFLWIIYEIAECRNRFVLCDVAETFKTSYYVASRHMPKRLPTVFASLNSHVV